MPAYYLMKVKGKAKIPDYIQLRDENLTLIGYFRPNRKERLDKIIKDPDSAAQIQKVIDSMEEYGRRGSDPTDFSSPTFLIVGKGCGYGKVWSVMCKTSI